MKNNLSYYRHEVGSHNHWKFKTLRRKYKWCGEGKFWALNNMIADSDGCRLHYDDPDIRAAVAAELDFDVEEFSDYVEYLIKPCKLLKLDDGFLTTSITQENLNDVNEKRERQRNWKKEKSTAKTPESTSTSPESTAKTDKSTVDFEQRKVKKSRVKESKEEKVNTTVGVPDKPATKLGVVRKKGKAPEPFWQSLVNTWFAFVQEKFGEPPLFTDDRPLHLRKIIEKLKIRAAQKKVEWNEQTGPDRLKIFLNYAFSKDNWLPANFTLENINKQFESIERDKNAVAAAVKQQTSVDPAVEIQQLYEKFQSGKPNESLIQEPHFNYLDQQGRLQITDDLFRHAVAKRMQNLTGSNQAAELRLLQAYEKNAQATADQDPGFGVVIKRLAVLGLFYELEKNNINYVFKKETV